LKPTSVCSSASCAPRASSTASSFAPGSATSSITNEPVVLDREHAAAGRDARDQRVARGQRQAVDRALRDEALGDVLGARGNRRCRVGRLLSFQIALREGRRGQGQNRSQNARRRASIETS
jgi:hypothetical protein